MSAPEYVPTKPAVPVRSYESPPRRPEPWTADRPGELVGDHPDNGRDGWEGQPRGEQLGSPGPDPGYAYKLLRGFRSKVHLVDGETWKDASTGAASVALKRSSLFGRAPVNHDLTVGFGVWGFLDVDAPADLLELRRSAFAGISHPADYSRLRSVVDAVPEGTLRLPHAEVLRRYAADWRSLLQMGELAGH
jgi:hypothetical protein